MKYFVTIGDQEREVSVDGGDVHVDGEIVHAHLAEVEGSPIRLLRIGSEVHPVVVRRGAAKGQYTLLFPDGGGQYTAQIMAKVHRAGGGWQMTALGNPANGRTFQDLMPAILPHL